jgi:uncharacterized BrkB/YihY/UPF0761 family membrane protein
MAKERRDRGKPKSDWSSWLPFLAGLFGLCIISFLIGVLSGISKSGTEIEKLSAACMTTKGLLPIVSLLSFILAVVAWLASLFLQKEDRWKTRNLALGLLFGGLMILVIASIFSYLFGTDIGYLDPAQLRDPKTTFIC